MANPGHLKILRKGVDAWNEWREKNSEIIPDLSRADLSYLQFCGGNLIEANLKKATLYYANLRNVNLDDACLNGAGLLGANFTSAYLARTDLRNVWMDSTVFSETQLSGANFEGARIEYVVFSYVDLSQVKGLDTITHIAPSTIGIDTIYLSQGKIPEKFLRDAGVPEELISYLPSLIGAVQPFQWHSCFISYSTKNEKFAKRLHARMRQAGLRVWFAPEDMRGGQYLDDQIDRAIQFQVAYNPHEQSPSRLATCER